MFGPQVLDRTAAVAACAEPARRPGRPHVREGELTQAAETRRAEDDAVLAARARPAVAGRGAAGWCGTGRALEQLPAVAAAFADGRVTAEQVAVIAPVTRPENVAAAAEQGVDLAGVDAALAETAATRPHAELAQVVHHYLERLDPDGPEPDPTEGRSLTIAKHADGSITGRFDLDAVGGEKVQAALESIVQANRPAGDTRTRAQQLGDAFVQLADNALAAGQPADPAHGQAARGRHHRHRRLRRPAHRPRRRRPPASAPGSPPPAPAGWPATAHITRIVIGPDGQPLDLGRDQAGVPAAHAQGGRGPGPGCVFAGCHAPTHWCDAHHLLRMGLDDGPTSVENGALLCETPPHQGPPRLPGRATTRRPMAHLAPRRHRDPARPPLLAEAPVSWSPVSLTIGIVGLPNVGKSTLFNALTKNDVLAANYPFATIEPNVGVVGVPDPRLAKLAEIFGSQKIIPATVVVRRHRRHRPGRLARAQGLGNKFLANIRESDAICQVIRVFTDPDVVHVDGKVEPGRRHRDDQHRADPRRPADAGEGDPAAGEGVAQGQGARRRCTPPPSRRRRSSNEGKTLFAAGIDPDAAARARPADHQAVPLRLQRRRGRAGQRRAHRRAARRWSRRPRRSSWTPRSSPSSPSCPTRRPPSCSPSIGQDEPGLDQLARVGFATLGLQTYLTAGPKEARAWTIPVGATAPQAAGVIHTDFQRGFIKAEIVVLRPAVEAGSMAEAKSKGWVRMEGKDYVMQDGDVVEFRFNV